MTVLAERYRLERELGAGGMATVHLAHDLKHDRAVAVKVIRGDLASGIAAERFTREIRLVAGLHHPNILPLYDSGEAEGRLFYVMPVAAQESLRDRLAREGPLDAAVALLVAREVAEALDYAHRHGVVHRDVKPDNILLHEGHALITDFGIGKAIEIAAESSTLTQLGVAVGTPAYMSPEQVSGDAVDGRSDLYSLGCVLYEMLTGAAPFEGRTAHAVIAQRFTAAPPDASTKREGVPRGLAAIAGKLMALAPDERYATGALVVDALSRSLTPQPGAVLVARERLPWIAVLPFTSTPREGAAADFAVALADDLSAGLAKFSYLQVVSRQAALRFAAEGGGMRRLQQDLGARYAIEGSVRQSGSRLRATAELVDAHTGAQLWAETFDRDAGADPFAVQDDLVDRIITMVADPYGVLVRAMVDRLRDLAHAELSIEELRLRFYAMGRQVSPEEYRAIRPAIEAVVKVEPRNAEAWGILAQLYWSAAMHGLEDLPDALPSSVRFASRAVELDPGSQLAWESLAESRYFSGDVEGFRPAAERALAINPRSSYSAGMLGMLIAFSGDWERGVAIVRRLIELNVQHAGWLHHVPFHHHLRRGEPEAALEELRRIEMPELLWTHTSRAHVMFALGRHDEVRAAMAELWRRFPALRDTALLQSIGRGWIRDEEYATRLNASMDGILRLCEGEGPTDAVTANTATS